MTVSGFVACSRICFCYDWTQDNKHFRTFFLGIHGSRFVFKKNSLKVPYEVLYFLSCCFGNRLVSFVVTAAAV